MARRILVTLSVVGVFSLGIIAEAASMAAPLDFSSTSSASLSDVDIRNAGDGAAASAFGSTVHVDSTTPEVNLSSSRCQSHSGRAWWL